MQTSTVGGTVATDPLPWRMLKYDVRQGGYVVDLDGRRLEEAPSYTTSDLPNSSDRTYVHRIDDYYGVPPYSFEPSRYLQLRGDWPMEAPPWRDVSRPPSPRMSRAIAVWDAR